MINGIKCQELFTNIDSLIVDLFNAVIYPWEIIPLIKSFIEEKLATNIRSYKQISPNVLVGDGVIIADSAKIEGPAIIGEGCEIRHGAVILGNGCVVGNSSEIKNSILMEKIQIPHFNYVGDSVLGNGVHLGAGAICSNLRSDKKSVVIKGKNFILDTGLKKLGAILGDGVEIGCGSVLCPGTVIGKNSMVYPLTLVRGIYPENSILKNEKTFINR